MQSDETRKLFMAMVVGFGIILAFLFWTALTESDNRDYLGSVPHAVPHSVVEVLS